MRRLFLSAVALLLLTAVQAIPQTQPRTLPKPAEKFTPRLEAIAETKLLMEGLASSNFRSLEKMLKDKPDSLDAWTFARGQALLIAETGNLLLLRPPKNQGRDGWQMRATELRDNATTLARALARRDLEASRTALTGLANTCNRCHQGFQVTVRVVPFSRPQE